MHLRFVLERHLVSLFSLKPASPQFGQIRVREGLAEPTRAIFFIFQKGKISWWDTQVNGQHTPWGSCDSRGDFLSLWWQSCLGCVNNHTICLESMGQESMKQQPPCIISPPYQAFLTFVTTMPLAYSWETENHDKIPQWRYLTDARIELFQVQGGKSNTEQRHTQNSWFLGTIFWSSSLQRWTFFSSYEEDGLFHESIYRPGAREGRCLFQGC